MVTQTPQILPILIRQLANKPKINSTDILSVSDSLGNILYKSTIKQLVLASGVSFDNENYKGRLLPNSDLPDNPGNKPIWGDVSNESGSTQTFTNFLDSDGDPIELEDGQSGKLTYDGISWSFARDLYNIDAIMAGMGITIISNAEFVYAIADLDGKILFGIKADGTTYIPAGMPDDVASALLGMDSELKAVETKTGYLTITSNTEFLYAISDKKGNILFGIRGDGTTYIPGGIPEDAAKQILSLFSSLKIVNDSITTINSYLSALNGSLNAIKLKTDYLTIFQNTEFLYGIVDADGKVLFGIRKDGSIQNSNEEKIRGIYDTLSDLADSLTAINGVISVFSSFSDKEGRIQMIKDEDGKVLSYRKEDGILHELAGIETPNMETGKLVFSGTGLPDLIADLKAAGIQTGKGDQSAAELVQLPKPSVISYLNFDIDKSQLPNTIDESIEVKCNAEYWDAYGNYFKKSVKLSTQGDSSLKFYRKSFSFDLDDDSELKFGNFSASDSYHLKGYYEDAFRGKEIVGYRLYKEIINSREYSNRYAFYDQYKAPSLYNGTGDLQFDSNSVANYVPDGFPVAIYCNGIFYGCYVLKQKKERDNMDMKKKDTDHVWIDGNPGTDGHNLFLESNVPWGNVPIRNPKDLIDIDGNEYDDDNPKELSDTDTNSKEVKVIIESLAGCILVIDAEITDEDRKSKFLEYFDLDSLIDFYLFSNVVYSPNWYKNAQWYTKNAGQKWAIGQWDVNLIFGLEWRGNTISSSITSSLLMHETGCPAKYLHTLFLDETLARYTQLRKEILTTTHIIDLLRSWLNEVTYNKLSQDLELWPETPSYRDGKINRDYWECVGLDGATPLWDEETEYSAGNTVGLVLTSDRYKFICVQANTGQNPVTGSYAHYPQDCGFYDSVDRVKQTLDIRIALLDQALGYNI